MRFYYGSNADFDKIDLAKCRPNKDFGQGVYLADIRSQTEAMAVRRCEFEETGIPIVQEYELDEHQFDSQEVKVKVLDGVSQEWAEFILMNRMAYGVRKHDYDIVVGPMADDGMVFQLNLYMQRLITMETLIKELTFRTSTTNISSAPSVPFNN